MVKPTGVHTVQVNITGWPRQSAARCPSPFE
jgi:hypothetical protein